MNKMLLAPLIAGMLALVACDSSGSGSGGTLPEPTPTPTTQKLGGVVVLEYTSSGDPSPYTNTDAINRTLELRLDPLDPQSTQLGQVVKTTLVNSDLSFKIDLPELAADQLGGIEQLPSQHPVRLTDSCYISTQMTSDPEAKVRWASLTIALPPASEPLNLIYSPPSYQHDQYATYYSEAQNLLLYSDRSLNDNLSMSCNETKESGELYVYEISSILPIKKGWNFIGTGVNISRVADQNSTRISFSSGVNEIYDQYAVLDK